MKEVRTLTGRSEVEIKQAMLDMIRGKPKQATKDAIDAAVTKKYAEVRAARSVEQ